MISFWNSHAPYCFTITSILTTSQQGKVLNFLQWNEYNWNATSIVIDGKIMKPNFAWYFTQTRVSGWSITRVSFATIPQTNYEERANDERTTWRQTWVPRESKFAVCLKQHYKCFVLAVLSFAWKDWERKASNLPPEVAFQLYSFHWFSPSTWAQIFRRTSYILYRLL